MLGFMSARVYVLWENESKSNTVNTAGAIAFVDKEAFLDPGDPHERHHIERRRLLEQRVAETLALKPSKPCPFSKGSEHGTYKLSPDEEENEIREYLRRSRQVRIMQVRAQEMLLAAQRVEEFRQRKKNEKHKLLQVLKEAWQEEHNKRIADVEEDLMTSCKGIGQSHNAAQEVTKTLASVAEEKVKQAEECRLWETLRYQKAKKEECARKSEAVDVDKLAAKDRRRVVACAAEIERTQARFLASRVKSKSMEEKRRASEEDRPTYLHPNFNSHDIKRSFIQSRLAGTPNDYKDTYFHSRFCVLKDKTNLSNTQGEHLEQQDAERDAWETAEAHLRSVELEHQQKAELEELWNKRKLERGHAAEAHLQKIASLEEELAMEVEQERERKHQLQLIEELSRAAQVSTYKADQSGHLDLKPHVNRVFGEQSAPANQELSDINAPDCCGNWQAIVSQPVDLETTQPAKQSEKATGRQDFNIEQLSRPPQDAGISSRQSTPDVIGENGDSDATGDEILDAKDTEIVDVRIQVPESPKKPSTPTKILKSSSGLMLNHFSPPKNKSGAELHSKALVNERTITDSQQSRGPSTDPNFPGRPPKVLNTRVPTKVQKCVESTPQASSPPNLNASNNIRKGNKSPQRLRSPGMAASNGHRIVDHVKEVGSRSRCRQTVEGKKAPEKRSTLPAIARTLETCPAEGKKTEGKKMTPRKHGSAWLSNVLEKLTWWKSNKGPLTSGTCTPQDTVACESHSILGGQRAKPYNRDVRKEYTPKFPVKQVDSPAKSRPLNKSLPPRSKNLEDTSSLAQSELQVDIEPGWYEACTKDVFSAEELEALQLELYGTWTDPIQSRAKPKRDKSRPGQQDHDSDNVNLQRKGESNGPSRSRANEKMADNSGTDRVTKDPAAQSVGVKFDIEQVTVAKGSARFVQKPLIDEVALSSEHFSLSCEPPESRSVEPELKGGFVKEKCLLTTLPALPEESQGPDCQSEVEIGSSNSDKVSPKPECGGSGEPISARDVAEKLISAWQTGLLGGSPCPTNDLGKQTSLQSSRKRRARTKESHANCGIPWIGGKVGRRKNATRAKEISAAKDGKWEIPFVWSQSSWPQEQQVPNANSLIQGQEKNRSVRASPKSSSKFTVQHSPLKPKNEAVRNNEVEDTAPEARSLDFILGSLSAQVKELDERLRNVTSCAIYSSFSDEHCLDRRNEECERVDDYTIKQLKVSSRSPSVKSPRIDENMVFHGDGRDAFSISRDNLPQHFRAQTGSTYRSGYRPQFIQQVQSPMSSMASCLENISDLMQEMSRSTGCENTEPQLPPRSSTGSIPTNPETNPKNGRNESEYGDNIDNVGVLGSEPNLLSHGGAKSCLETTSRVSSKFSAEWRSGIIHRDGNTSCSLPFVRGSLSSLNLAEAMSLDEIEEQLLLSGSVDFSPWNTEKLPDLFSSIANVAMSINSTVEHESNHGDGADLDCEGTLRPVYCHVKKESEWLLRGNKFKVKSKAYEKPRTGKGKGKVKRSPKKAFNPVAKPPRHSSPRRHSTAAVWPKVSTTRIQPTAPLRGAIKFQKRELRVANDGASKFNLTTRSLPAQFPGSVTAEEVQKWLCREAAVSYPATSPVGTPSKETAAVRHQLASYKRPDSSESVAGQRVKLHEQSPLRMPDLGLRDSTWRKKTTQPVVDSRRRPASAGAILKN